MECMLHARLGCRLWVPSPPLLWHREAGVPILRPPNLSDPVSVSARADISRRYYGTGRPGCSSYGRPTSLTLCQFVLAPIYVFSRMVAKREREIITKRTHARPSGGRPTQHTKVATASKDTDRPRQSDMDRPTHACTNEAAGACRSGYRHAS